MSSPLDADSLFRVSSTNRDRFKRNVLELAVCEFRFPTLLELSEPKPPAGFVHALRKEYPHIERANELTFGAGSHESNTAHVFRSTKGDWSISLRQSMFALETKKYKDYEGFKRRVANVVSAASKVIDSDFFTRVGLRYVNVVDVGENPANDWINERLVGPLKDSAFMQVHDYSGKILMQSDDGGALLQHGIRFSNLGKGENAAPPAYVIDIDIFRNDVLVADYEAVLDRMHQQAFDIFDWAIGEKLRERLTLS